MAQNQMLDQNFERRGKARDRPAFLPHQRGADRDVAQQAPGVRIVDAALIAQLLDFSDVVQHHSGEQQIGV